VQWVTKNQHRTCQKVGFKHLQPTNPRSSIENMPSIFLNNNTPTTETAIATLSFSKTLLAQNSSGKKWIDKKGWQAATENNAKVGTINWGCPNWVRFQIEEHCSVVAAIASREYPCLLRRRRVGCRPMAFGIRLLRMATTRGKVKLNTERVNNVRAAAQGVEVETTDQVGRVAVNVCPTVHSEPDVQPRHEVQDLTIEILRRQRVRMGMQYNDVHEVPLQRRGGCEKGWV
jgi:hypothetical protein